jgi:hypothetical protein
MPECWLVMIVHRDRASSELGNSNPAFQVDWKNDKFRDCEVDCSIGKIPFRIPSPIVSRVLLIQEMPRFGRKI